MTDNISIKNATVVEDPAFSSSSITSPVNLLDFDRQGLQKLFASFGEAEFRGVQLLQWIHQYGVTDFAAMSNLSKKLREHLQSICILQVPEIVWEQHAQDGTRKWLLRLTDGNCIETVFIPENFAELDDESDADEIREIAANQRCSKLSGRMKNKKNPAQDHKLMGEEETSKRGKYRGTLCVSSQVGCVVNCSFCSTAQQGFSRNLTVAEIIGQVWLAVRKLSRDNQKHDRQITNVVMMGMGEPLLNFDNVVKAMNIMMDDFAYGLSKRRVTLSTSGIVPALEKLSQVSDVALAVSLHAPNDELRNQLVPINRKYPLRELLGACRRYFQNDPRRRITMEYVMLDGINDAPEHARELVKILQGIPVKMNLIPFNPFPDTRYKRSPQDRIEKFKKILLNAGLNTITRKTRGDDIDAACGQLVGRVQDRTQRTRQKKIIPIIEVK